ncbi:WYL domain-containing protein [Chloroflexia bacterium SDU3-3]|nr:WYL domain-containing protein [Chloroflexia bacterium SDU3-3]
MTSHTGGIKRSSQFTFRRRLTLIRQLLREPQRADDLIDAARLALGDESYPVAAQAALKHDLDALKAEYGCDIRFDRSSRRYVLEDLGELALLDLPDTCMEALSFLDATFPEGGAIPQHAYIHQLLKHVRSLLPQSRRDMLARQHGTISLALRDGGTDQIDAATLATVRRACKHRELFFRYRSAAFDHESWFRVAPYEVFFSPEGHSYLDATPLDSSEHIPIRNEPKHYRIDRIVPGSAKVLPQVLPPTRPQPPTYQLRYRLSSNVAKRRDVATYFPNTVFDYHDDGTATVTATITNIWQARHILLRYGSGCTVESPPELVEMFRDTVRGMVAAYLPDQASGH